MANENEKPNALHSFLGGMLLTILLVVVIPILSAWLIEPIVIEYLGDVNIDPLTPGTFVTAAMLVVLILFLLLLGGGKIFKKYGVIGVVGLVAAYWFLGRPYDAILPVAIILIFVAISYLRGKK